MSETSSKKNSIVDKILLGAAGGLAIGMFAFGSAGEKKAETEEKAVVEQEGADGEKDSPAPAEKKEAQTGTPKKSAAAQKELAKMKADLAKVREVNANLAAELRAKKMALEMRDGKPVVDTTKAKELDKAKAELEKLKAKLAEARKSVPSSKDGKMDDLDALKKEMEAELKRKDEAIKAAKEALKAVK
jgi:hypothetical protein